VVAHEQVLAVDVLEQIDNAEEALLDLLLVVFSTERFLSEQTVHVRCQHFRKLIFFSENVSAVEKLIEALK